MIILNTIIATLFVHSAIGCILYLATKNNEEILAFWGGGIICAISNGVTAIIYFIRKATHKKFFKALLVDKDDKLYYCESKQVDSIRFDVQKYKNLELKFATKHINEKYTINDGWRKTDCHKSFGETWVLSAKYTPIKICKAEGAEDLKIK